MSGGFEGEDDRKRGDGDEHKTTGKGVDKTQPSGGELHTGDQVGRDELAQADYGGTERNPATSDEPQQDGGVSEGAAEGEGRTPTSERDRDYDPDGDRTGR